MRFVERDWKTMNILPVKSFLTREPAVKGHSSEFDKQILGGLR